MKTEIENKRYHISDQFDSDREMIALREPYIPEYYEAWEEGFKNYLEGDWE